MYDYREAADVTIRCCLLGECIAEALEEEKVIIYESDYERDIDELKEQIQELQEELNNI